MFDLQVNGLTTNSFSCDFWSLPEDESIHALRKYELDEGVFMFLATLITAPYEQIEANLKHIEKYKEKYDKDSDRYLEIKKSQLLANAGKDFLDIQSAPDSSANQMNEIESAHIYGVHIEGGLISKMGIHPEAHAKEFNLKNVQELVKKYPGLIKLWTLCPKADTNGDVTRFLQDSSIKVAYGHSDASYDEAMSAFDKYGVDFVTHWCNGMSTFPGFQHRGGSKIDYEHLENINLEVTEHLGIGVAAYHNPKIALSMICGSEADGDLHLDSYLLHKAAEKKKGKVVFVSDSVAAENGKSYDKSKLRGGTVTLSNHVSNAFEAMVGIAEVQEATSITPYKVMGII